MMDTMEYGTCSNAPSECESSTCGGFVSESSALLPDLTRRRLTAHPPYLSAYQYSSEYAPDRSRSFPMDSSVCVSGAVRRQHTQGGAHMVTHESAASLLSDGSTTLTHSHTRVDPVHERTPVREYRSVKELTADKPASLLSS